MFRVLGKRIAARSAQRLRADRRQPVVFLRAFADDSLAVAGVAAEGSWISRAQRRRLESAIDEWCERIGPFVALGRPGERLPLDGAARDYAAADWDSKSMLFLHDASMIVLVVAGNRAHPMETCRLTECGFLAKTLWIVPPVSTAEALRRWRACIAEVQDARCADRGAP